MSGDLAKEDGVRDTIPDDGDITSTEDSSSSSDDEVVEQSDSVKEKVAHNTYKTLRLTKADLLKFPNYDSSNCPDNLEDVTCLIEGFIEQKREKSHRKRKLNDTRSFSELLNPPILEKLELTSETEKSIGAATEDFKLLIFHSKTVPSSNVQKFTKTLVTGTAGENIVTEKPSSSLIYFFYRISEIAGKPEIFIITTGHLWRLAQEIGCETFPKEIKERDLEKEPIHYKSINVGGGAVHSTEYHARAGVRLKEDVNADRIVSKSTQMPRQESSLNKHRAFKTDSKIFVSNTSLSTTITLDITEIHGFLKHISQASQANQSGNQYKLENVTDQQLKQRLDQELFKRLTEKDEDGRFCTEKYLQSEETRKWNKLKKLTLCTPNKDIRLMTVPFSFCEIFTELKKFNVPEKVWFQSGQVSIKWGNYNHSLQSFLEDYIIQKNTFYRYRFGQWVTINDEYITGKEKEFKQILIDHFLPASRDFPILPWIYISERRRLSENNAETPRSGRSLATLRKDSNQNDSGFDISQHSPASQSYSHTASFDHDSSERKGTVDLNTIGVESSHGWEKFKTEPFEKISGCEIIHYPFKVNFDEMLKNKNQNENTKTETNDKKGKMIANYSVGRKKKVSSLTYFIPSLATKTEIANLLFLRLNTPLTEGEYNDCHMILRKLMEVSKDKRFVIIPGDELFVARKNIELYDILISDEKEKVTYIIHVKAGFGQKTRDVCSQLRLSADCIKNSILLKSSSSELKHYWQENSQYEFTKEGYKEEVARILTNLGEKKFLELFTDDERKLVFVYACRDTREANLQKEFENSIDISISDENAVRHGLVKDCRFPKTTVDYVVDQMKKKNILSGNGKITNEYVLQGANLIEGISIPHGDKQKAQQAIRKILKERISYSDSYIAKWELIYLKQQFDNYCAGDRQFELKICQIPLSFYLKKDGDDEENAVTSDAEDSNDDTADETSRGGSTSDRHKSSCQTKKGLITDFFSVC